jgi:hypothetical protein
MGQNMIKNTMKLFAVFFFTIVFFASSAFAEDTDDRTKLIAKAQEPFLNGEYEKAIKIFDEILEIYPRDSEIFEMKGVALSNLRLESTLAMKPQEGVIPQNPSNLNRLSILEFYKAAEINPNSVIALNGLGLGFGNFGEYLEAEKYFKKSIKLEPNNPITQNYIKSLETIKKKYSIVVLENPTKKPAFLQQIDGEKPIPYWIKNNAEWWSEDKINDDDFISGIEYLVNQRIINISSYINKENSSDIIPSWIKNNAGWWSDGKISDEDFLSGIKYLIENNMIKINVTNNPELALNELERKAWNFDVYLKDIQHDVKVQKRYVENINPSEYVIIKYWKDYHKWNLEQFLNAPEFFPDRNVRLDPETDRYLIEYKIYINDQPHGLPIDHISSMKKSYDFWEKYEFNTSDNKKAYVKFETTNLKAEANVWVTWVVRNIGEGVLGHANLGKGVVEVAIGSHNCDGSFQLLDVDTVEYIMTHELGHSLGLNHSTNPDNIMHGVVPHTGYAFCLLDK